MRRSKIVSEEQRIKSTIIACLAGSEAQVRDQLALFIAALYTMSCVSPPNPLVDKDVDRPALPGGVYFH